MPLLRDLLSKPWTLDLSTHPCVRRPLGPRSTHKLKTMQVYIRRAALGTTEQAALKLSRFADKRPADRAWSDIATWQLHSESLGHTITYVGYIGITDRDAEIRKFEDAKGKYRAVSDFVQVFQHLEWLEHELNIDIWVPIDFGERVDNVVNFVERTLIAALGASSLNRAMGGSRPEFVVDSQEQQLIARVHADLDI